MKIKTYEIYPGAVIETYDVCSGKVYFFDRLLPEDQWSLRLDYCISGRLEAEFTGNKCAHLDAGQMAVNTHRYEMRSSHFPLKLYKGLSILIYKPKLAEKYLQIWKVLGLDIDEINEKVDRNAVWMIERASPKMEEVFGTLYFAAGEEEPEFIWIKLTELLYQVKKMVNDRRQEYFYFAGDAADRMKNAVKQVLHSREYSVERMIELSGIGASAFYENFGKIYGTSPAKYVRDFRLGEAAAKLVSTKLSIQNIAAEAGYLNSSKFSSAFRKLYGISPTEYRNKRLR